jgi:hypothetical protein
MDILKRLRIERNALLKRAKQARKEAAQLLKRKRWVWLGLDRLDEVWTDKRW